ncbi:MAG TPA: hypothetical protein V6C97_20590 [Oculatellaceae cyanobacterium]
MKGLFAFCAGAVAGFLVGSTKQGLAWRSDLEERMNSLLGKCCNANGGGEFNSQADELFTEPSGSEKSKASNKTQAQTNSNSKPESKPESKPKSNTESESEPMAEEKSSGLNEASNEKLKPNRKEALGMEKAQELAQKLGAKVSEPEGEEALPFAHPIETSTSKLSA